MLCHGLRAARLAPQTGDSLDELRFGVGLLEHPSIDLVSADPATVAFRLDRVDPSGANHDVIDVALVQIHIVKGKPTPASQLVKHRADALLPLGPSSPALDQRSSGVFEAEEHGDNRASSPTVAQPNPRTVIPKMSTAISAATASVELRT